MLLYSKNVMMVMADMNNQSELIQIPAGRGCHYMLYPQEIIRNLPQELLMKGLKRCKALSRRRERERRAEEQAGRL